MKVNKLAEFVIVVSVLFVVSFLLNFLWETLHSVYLYDAHGFRVRCDDEE